MVTVLMTVYNGGEYLRPAMESLFKQTFQDFEFLVIDDCSKDQSVDVIRSFADPRIRLYINDENMGQTRTLNKGLGLARGRFIARLDADDLAFPQWLEKNLERLQKCPQSAVVSCKAVVIDSQNRIRRILNTPVHYDDMVMRSLLQSPINHVGSIYRTDVIQSVGGYDEEYKIAADYQLWSKLIHRKIQMDSHPEPLVAIRFHEKSISRLEQGRTDFQEITRIMVENFNQLTTLSVTSQDIRQLWRLCYTPEVLSAEEFTSAIKVLKAGYQRIKSEYQIPPDRIQTFIRQQMRTLYVKKMFACIRDQQMPAVRNYVQGYFDELGVVDVFGTLWLGSWMGPSMIGNIPQWFESWNSLKTRQQIKLKDMQQLALKS